MAIYLENNQSPEAPPRADEDGIGLLDIILVITENLRLLIIGPLTIGAIAFGLTFFIPPTYRSEVKFIPPQQQSAAIGMLQSLGAIGSLASSTSGLKNPMDQYVALLRSVTVQDAMVEKFDLLNRYGETYRVDARGQLEENTRIGSGKDGLITVAVEDSEPAFAAQVANGYVDELRQLLNRLAVTEAQQRRLFFEKQLTDTKDRLTAAQQSLAESGVSLAAVNTNPATALEVPARLRAQVTALEVRMASLRSYLAATAPEIRQLQAELSALRSELSKAEQAQPAAGKGADYIAKFREFKYQETLFDLFARQFELAKVDESKEGAVIQVVDLAKPAERKFKPRKAIIAITSALVAAVLLLVLVFTRHAARLVAEGSDPVSAAKLARLKEILPGSRR